MPCKHYQEKALTTFHTLGEVLKTLECTQATASASVWKTVKDLQSIVYAQTWRSVAGSNCLWQG